MMVLISDIQIVYLATCKTIYFFYVENSASEDRELRSTYLDFAFVRFIKTALTAMSLGLE
jgi:hypothetical protein